MTLIYVKYSSTCKTREKEVGQCYGFVARLSQAVEDIKSKEENNLLNFDAMTLGNQEFDDKIAGLQDYV